MLDMGGEDSPLDDKLLACLRLLSANETELQRATGLPIDSEDEVMYCSHAFFVGFAIMLTITITMTTMTMIDDSCCQRITR
jgi:sugar/nucleoside kinase (ribokinase family)